MSPNETDSAHVVEPQFPPRVDGHGYRQKQVHHDQNFGERRPDIDVDDGRRRRATRCDGLYTIDEADQKFGCIVARRSGNLTTKPVPSTVRQDKQLKGEQTQHELIFGPLDFDWTNPNYHQTISIRTIVFSFCISFPRACLSSISAGLFHYILYTPT